MDDLACIEIDSLGSAGMRIAHLDDEITAIGRIRFGKHVTGRDKRAHEQS